MCARRFLMLIFILTLLMVGAAFALYQWGGQMLIKSATPQGHFEVAAAGSGPDYSVISNWLDRPELPNSPSRWRPTNDAAPVMPGERAAIFYVHPTTYLEKDRWNAPICEGEECGEAGKRAALFVQSQASAFNRVGTVWAPRYRQAAFGAFLLRTEDAERALNLAYGDVLAAFDYFLAHRGQDKPIILAGHSQGSLHLLRLLKDRRSVLNGRLVAAYIVGWPIGITSDLPVAGFPACAEPNQTGCVISWQSFKEPDNTSLVTDAWVGTKGLTGATRTRNDMLCTNPLTGTRDGAASPEANQGTLVPNGDLSNASLDAGRVGASCDNGFLNIDGDVPNLGPYVLPGNNYHVYDYALFWGSIRADAERRVMAWRK
jgi:hypothetical protein